MSEKRRDSNGRILKTGESQRANGSYQYRYKDIRKETKCVYASTLTELRAKEEKIQKDITDHIDYDGSKTTLAELLDKYFELKSPRIRPTTKQEYSSLIKTSKKYDLCHIPIGRLKKSEAKKWMIQLKEDGMSYGTIKTIKGVLRAAIQVAVEDDLIRKNPMDFSLPSVLADDTKSKTSLTDEEFNGVLAFMMKSGTWRKYCPMAIIMIETGIRVSELCGLTVSDIDFSNKSITICKQLKKTQHGEYYIEKPKTKSGNRVIPLTEKALVAFKSAIKERQKVKTEVLIDGVGGFIFLCKTGKPKTGALIDYSFARLMAEYNEKNNENLVMTPHTLRHTFCTNLAKSGLPVKDLQYLMGHADFYTTMDTYTHVDFESVRNNFYGIRQAL